MSYPSPARPAAAKEGWLATEGTEDGRGNGYHGRGPQPQPGNAVRDAGIRGKETSVSLCVLCVLCGFRRP